MNDDHNRTLTRLATASILPQLQRKGARLDREVKVFTGTGALDGQ
jgi:hypothetical protein